MASIPGPIVLAIGVAVSAFSFFLNDKGFGLNGPYSLFLYVGLAIMAYGLAKTIIWLVTKPSNEEKKEEAKKNISDAQAQKQAVPSQSVYDKLQKEDYDEDRYRVVTRCPTCGLSHYSYANFCQNCGTRLK